MTVYLEARPEGPVLIAPVNSNPYRHNTAGRIAFRLRPRRRPPEAIGTAPPRCCCDKYRWHSPRVSHGGAFLYGAEADERIGKVYDAVPVPRDLVVDATGVGKPVFDALAASERAPVGVVITGGKVARQGDDGLWRLPKSILAQSVAGPLESGLLKISSALLHAPILLAELQAFRASIGESGHATFEAAPGVNDDLVLAVALAIWRLQAQAKKTTP
jgi:hypothetical protein